MKIAGPLLIYRLKAASLAAAPVAANLLSTESSDFILV